MVRQYDTVATLVDRVQEMDGRKNDYLVPVKNVQMLNDESMIVDGLNDGIFALTDLAHDQVADWLKDVLGVKGTGFRSYYRQMTQIKGMRTRTLDEIFQWAEGRRMLRTYPNLGRAWLSDSFRPIDNAFVLAAIVPLLRGLHEQYDVQIKANALTETHMYIQVYFGNLAREVERQGFTPGDHRMLDAGVVIPGISIRNSEVGKSAFDVSASLFKTSCANMLVAESLVRRYHSGRRIGRDWGDDGEDFSIYRDDTLKADLQAYQLRIRDIVAHATSEAQINARMQSITDATADAITEPAQLLENVTKRFDFSEQQGKAMTDTLMLSEDMTRWGLVNSITALAHELDARPDTQFDIERAGGEILRMNPRQWEALQN